MIIFNPSYNKYKDNNLKPQQIKQSSDISFGIKMEPKDYDDCYEPYSTYNGYLPDSYILKNIKKYFPVKENIKILDLGSGEGRNTIPIAKKGYEVTGVEISKKGVYVAINNAINAEVEDKVSFVNNNLLDTWAPKPEFDFAFLSHVSMHLNNSELKKVFTNVHKVLKDNGIFTLDVLLSKNLILIQTKNAQLYGRNHFKKNKVINMAKQCGFELVEISKFNEKGRYRASYEKQTGWGGNIPDYGISKKQNVQLTWLTFKKIKH